MKKLNKFFAILVSLAMMATLCVCMAFAEGPKTAEGVYYGTASGENAAVMTKYLQSGKGVTKPGATFNFKLDPQNGAPAAAGDLDIADSEMTEDTNGDWYKTLTLAEMVGNAFSVPGVYEYTLTELAPTGWTQKTAADKAGYTDELTKSNSTYTVKYYVVNDGNGVKIDKITVTSKDGKIDSTITKDIADEGQDQNGNDVGCAFTNTYKRQLTPGDEEEQQKAENGALNVTKEVKGEYGNKQYKFPFTVTVNLPAANKTGTVKYKTNKDGEIKTATVSNGVATITDVTLGHGDKLIFTDIPQGSTYTVKERMSDVSDLQNADKYSTTIDGDTATTNKADHEKAYTEALAETAKTVAVENALNDSDVTPTGILISNLPYIALALVAIGGLVAYVVVRRRDSEEA